MTPIAKRQKEEAAAAEAAREVYKYYGSNKQKADAQVTEILRGLRSGENLASLFLKAIDVIAVMTDNRAIYDQAHKDLIAIYAEGLQDAAAAGMLCAEIEARLQRLQAAEPTGADESRRIKAAIAAHQERLQALHERLRA